MSKPANRSSTRSKAHKYKAIAEEEQAIIKHIHGKQHDPHRPTPGFSMSFNEAYNFAAEVRRERKRGRLSSGAYKDWALMEPIERHIHAEEQIISSIGSNSEADIRRAVRARGGEVSDQLRAAALRELRCRAYNDEVEGEIKEVIAKITPKRKRRF